MTREMVERGRAAMLLPLLLLLGGCLATRQDLREVRAQLDSVQTAQARQTELLRALQRQAQGMLDSLSSQSYRGRADLANRMLQLERQLVQVQELAGQGQQQLAQLRQQMAARAREIAADSAVATPSQPPERGAGSANELYDAALAAYQRGSLVTARAGFEELLRTAPGDRNAASAQYYIGETYVQGNELDRAVAAFNRVVERYPSAARAATALFRSGQVERSRGNDAAARAAFQRVTRAYPNAPEATRARTELGRMQNR